MVSKYKYKNLTWVDLLNPTREELDHIKEEYAFSDLILEEMINPTIRSKVDLYEDILYLVLHFPDLPISKEKKIDHEIDFIIGKNFLITTRYAPLETFDEFARIFDSEAYFKKKVRGEHSGFLFIYFTRELYKNAIKDLESVDDMLRDIEEDIFQGKEVQMVSSISILNRKLLDFKQCIRFHNDVLRSFEMAGKQFFGESFSYYLTTVIGEYEKLKSVVDGNKEILRDLRETNDSLLTTKTNHTIKTLTIVTFIMLPLTLITGIFGMNTPLPLIDSTNDFILVIVAMLLLATVMIIYFRNKKWL